MLILQQLHRPRSRPGEFCQGSFAGLFIIGDDDSARSEVEASKAFTLTSGILQRVVDPRLPFCQNKGSEDLLYEVAAIRRRNLSDYSV
jgi:hypothetical protein